MEYRELDRFGPLALHGEVEIGEDWIEAFVTNIGPGGVFVALEDPPPVGAEVTLRTRLPFRLGELRATARVIWSSGPEDLDDIDQADEAGAGLLFTELDGPSRVRLKSCLKRLRSLSASVESLYARGEHAGGTSAMSGEQPLGDAAS